MSFTYSIDGDRVLLTQATTDDYANDPEVKADVQAFAKRRANATGKAVDVYADDGVTWLYAVAPDPPAA